MINYYLLTKPGIIFGNLLTVAAGFILSLEGRFDLALFCSTLLGLGLVMAAACVFNNSIDRKIDQKMERTKNRALANGKITNQKALFFGSGLAAFGFLILLKFTNPLATFIAFIGFFVYVVLYSLWKCHTIYATAIGSIAGGVPPLVGYCAVSNHFDLGALLFFAIMFLWQMPHFFSIAIFHFDDYVAASIPAFPIKKGLPATKTRMILYVIGFILATLSLTLLYKTSLPLILLTACIGALWLIFCIKGYQSGKEKKWGKNLFRLSLAAITILCLTITLDHFL